MKDLPLSLLSRGCGRFVSSNRNTGREDGRLDVCFTPEDYYIWKSQDSLLRLSNSGRLLVEAESSLPKTYSTRRGPLLLYSQDLVTMETSRHSGTRDRKQRVVRRYSQQVEQQLSTLKELTAAILSYSNTQLTSARLAPLFLPPLHLPLAPDLHRPSPPPLRTTQEQPSPELLVQLNPHYTSPAERRSTEQAENRPEDKEEEHGSRKRVRLDLFLQIPCASRTPTPQMEPQPWVHYVGMTPEEPEGPQTCEDSSLQHTESSQQTGIKRHSMEEELHHPNMNWVHDMDDDRGCSIQDSGTTGDTNERSMSGNRRGGIGFLPPLTVGHSVSNGPRWEKTDKPRWEGLSSDEHHARCLPPITESRTVAPGRAVQAQTQQDAQPKAERVGFQSQEHLNRLHQQSLFLPLLFPGKEEEISGKQRGGGEKTERQYYKRETVGQEGGGGGGRGRGGLPSEKGSVILLEPGDGPPPPVGVLGCVAGRKGPGKQSSLAFLQNRLLDLQDPCESSDGNRGVVRGVLPLELRDLQNGKSVGSVILGPDGEIIQLSLYDSSQDPSHNDGDTQEQALQVLSAEGEELPWVIVLQPEHTHTEGEVELNTDVPVGDVQHHQSVHKLLDLHRSTETPACSPSSHTDPAVPAAVTKKQTKGAKPVVKMWGKDAKNNIRMPPLKEQVGKEEPRGGGGNTEAEEEDEEEELDSTGQTRHLSGSHQPGSRTSLSFKDRDSSRQNIIPIEAPTADAVDKRRENTKRKDAEEAATTRGKRETKTVKSAKSEVQNQKTSRTRKEGRRQRQKTGSDAQSIRSQKQEERTNREAAETSALPSVKKTMTDREEERGKVKMNEVGEERGEVKMNEEGEERGEVKMNEEGEQRGEVKMNEEGEERGEVARQKEESAGRKRRRRRLKHKELVVGNHEDPLEKEEVEISQEISTRSPSATQRHDNKTKSNPEEDTDTEHLPSNADNHSSVGSVSSLRSVAAASQFSQRSSRKSAAPSCEGAVEAGAVALASSRVSLSSCSTVMVPEEQLMLNPVKPEFSRPRKTQEEEREEAAALRRAERAERRRQEVERKRREREEEERKQQEREQTEEKMKNELEGERKKRAEELRLKKLAEEEERRKREEEEQERARREEAQRERERRKQEERRRQMERLQRMREEEEQRRKVELERLRLEEERKQEEERKKLQEMDESERIEYLCRKEQEEENRRNEEEERKRREEEAAMRAAEEARMQAELLARQMALLQQQLAFKRGLVLEAGGLEKTQGISRPWVYSYFTLLQLLGLNPTTAETTTSDL